MHNATPLGKLVAFNMQTKGQQLTLCTPPLFNRQFEKLFRNFLFLVAGVHPHLWHGLDFSAFVLSKMTGTALRSDDQLGHDEA